MNLKNKVIVVTGAAQGLGHEIAMELAGSGAKVALVDITLDNLKQAEELHAKCEHLTRSYACDISDESQVIQLFTRILNDMGSIDGLVNNAGILSDGLLLKVKDSKVVDTLSMDSWQKVIDVNLTGVFLCAREAAKHMVNEKNSGVIVNMSSISRAGNVGQTNYAASKAGVAAMTVTWAKELSRYGIRVAAIAPGFIETEMTGSIRDDILDQIKSTIPLKKLGNPNNIAKTVKFIFDNDYISGRVLEIDGALRI